ncbi:MAG: hypothetical protein ACRDBG_19465, partial [Waterburya sp.]
EIPKVEETIDSVLAEWDALLATKSKEYAEYAEYVSKPTIEPPVIHDLNQYNLTDLDVAKKFVSLQLENQGYQAPHIKLILDQSTEEEILSNAIEARNRMDSYQRDKYTEYQNQQSDYADRLNLIEDVKANEIKLSKDEFKSFADWMYVADSTTGQSGFETAFLSDRVALTALAYHLYQQQQAKK